GAVQTVTGGGAITISTPNLTFAAGSQLIAGGASAMTVNAGGLSSNITVTAPNNSTGTLKTTGGSITFNTPSGYQLIFVNSNGNNSPQLAEMDLLGGNITLNASSPGQILIQPQTKLFMDSAPNINGPLNNQGQLVTAGDITIITSLLTL